MFAAMVMIEGNPCLLGVRNLGRLRKLQREQEPKSPFVFTSERNSPFSTGTVGAGRASSGRRVRPFVLYYSRDCRRMRV